MRLVRLVECGSRARGRRTVHRRRVAEVVGQQRQHRSSASRRSGVVAAWSRYTGTWPMLRGPPGQTLSAGCDRPTPAFLASFGHIWSGVWVRPARPDSSWTTVCPVWHDNAGPATAERCDRHLVQMMESSDRAGRPSRPYSAALLAGAALFVLAAGLAAAVVLAEDPLAQAQVVRRAPRPARPRR